MAIIHMETEQVREIVRLMQNRLLEMYVARDRLRSSKHRLAMAWQSKKANRFQRDFDRLIKRYENAIREFEFLAQRASREVDEWENVDSSDGTRRWSIFLSPHPSKTGRLNGIGATTIASVGMLLPYLSKDTSISKKKLWFAEEIEINGKIEGNYKTKTGMRSWHRNEYFSTTSKGKPNKHREKLDVGFEESVPVYKTSYLEGKNFSVGKVEGGVKFGAGNKGFSAGVYGEVAILEAHKSMVLGSSMFGFTLTGEGSIGSGEAFVGIKDNSLGASIGASVASGQVGVGFNILGANIQLTGGVSAGLHAGIKLGAKSEAKLGVFTLGIRIGKAIEKE